MSAGGWDSEAAAAIVMRFFDGGSAVPRDTPSAPDGTHDFDLLRSDGSVVAVEVTTHTFQAARAILAAIVKHEWKVEGLEQHWVLDMNEAYDVRAVHREAPALILAIEEAGLENESIRYLEAVHAHHDLLKPLEPLGVAYVYPLCRASDGLGTLVLGEASKSFSTGTAVINEVVEHHANLADNRSKLERVGAAAARHLFVWVESSRHQAVAALSGSSLPTTDPTVPAAVDAVWLATAFEQPRVIRWSRALGWEQLGSASLI